MEQLARSILGFEDADSNSNIIYEQPLSAKSWFGRWLSPSDKMPTPPSTNHVPMVTAEKLLPPLLLEA